MTPILRRAFRLTLAAMAASVAVAPAAAERYANFRCADGAGFSLIFEKGGRTGLVMIEGGALRLQNRSPPRGSGLRPPTGNCAARAARRRSG